jgi:hypothetical protein
MSGSDRDGGLHSWEGTQPCQGINRDGGHCGYPEIEGLDYCFSHVPDEFLAEAELITGMRRCTQTNRGTDGIERCRKTATTGTEPPRCKAHGANAGNWVAKRAAGNVVQANANDRLAGIMSEHGQKLLTPPPLEDPLSELLAVAAEIKALKDLLREMVSKIDIERWRYTRSRIGEQVRAEVLLYERSQERLAGILISVIKLNIEARLAKIKAAQVAKFESALDAALIEAGVPLDRQVAARKAVVRHLRTAS